MTMLCSDKTGTLTLNRLTINREEMQLYADVDIETCLLYSARSSRILNADAIDTCIIKTLGPNGAELAREGIQECHFVVSEGSAGGSGIRAWSIHQPRRSLNDLDQFL
jgi:H+-transporting ATPase